MSEFVPSLHPHLFPANIAQSLDYTSPQTARNVFQPVNRDRGKHASDLRDDLNSIREEAELRSEMQKEHEIEHSGITIAFQSEPNFGLKFDSLDITKSGIELLNVQNNSSGQTTAAVFVPDGKLQLFLNKIDKFELEDTKPKNDGTTRPKNEDLIANIQAIRVATLEALWTDTSQSLPDMDDRINWEVWLRKTVDIADLDVIGEIAKDFNLTVATDSVIEFVDRLVLLIDGKGNDLLKLNDLLSAIAELRLAKTKADLFINMETDERQLWVDDLLARTTAPPADSPHVCLFDTGLNRNHPLISLCTSDEDLHTYNPSWGVDDREGHGTPMAGLAIYGDLTDVLESGEDITLTHNLESFKLVNEASPHAPHLFGAVTQEGVAGIEVSAERKRVFCIAITAEDTDRGRPSSWSAAVDDLASGRSNDFRRLIILSAGNTSSSSRAGYPDSNFVEGVQDPGQAWNAITVGGYTEKSIVDQSKYPGWMPLADHGDLAPSSCTSFTWSQKSRWPIKPDIVLEAGNMAVNESFDQPDYIDPSLDLLTTAHDYTTRGPLTTFGDTSGSAALAARLAGMVMQKYPDLSPEAVRALMIHSANWTQAMRRRFTDRHGMVDYRGLVKLFGYGVPNERELLSSADNSLTLIVQDTIEPFHKDGSRVKPREMKLHRLPWPERELEDLLDTEVTMRVTLSYFVEPNPGSRGWSSKFGYQSHGLRFAVKRAQEADQAFVTRINKAARDDEYDADHSGDTGEWMFNRRSSLQALGSIRSNVWKGSAADLAARGQLAVFPTYGWWNRRPNLGGHTKNCHYALVVTITTPETDIYTSVANEIGIAVEVEG